MDGWKIGWWPAMLFAALLSQGCGKAFDETGRRPGEGPALPLKKPIYALEESAEAQPEKKKPKRDRRRNPGAALPVRPMTPAKSDAPQQDLPETPEVLLPEFSWDDGLAMGFVPYAWPLEINSLLVKDPKGIKSQEVASLDQAVRLALQSDRSDEGRHIGGIRILARRARGLMMDFELDSQEGGSVQFVSVQVTDQKGRGLGRSRLRLPRPKSKESRSRRVQTFKFDGSDPDFNVAGTKLQSDEAHWVEILFQVAPESTASVTLHHLAVLPALPEPVEVINRESFLRVEELPDEPSITQRIVEIQGYVDDHGGDWKTWFDSLESSRKEIESQLRDQQGYLTTTDGHGFAHLERICHTPSEAWPGPQIKALTALDHFLAQQGIELWIVPIPSSEQVFADRFVSKPPQDGRVDVYRDYLLQSLMRQNLKVVDVWPTLRRAGNSRASERQGDESGRASSLFHSAKTDELTNHGKKQVAKQISEALVRLNLRPDFKALGLTRTEIEISASLKRELSPGTVEYQWVPQVLDSGGTPLDTSLSGSDVLLVGDDSVLTPQSVGATGVGLAPYITLATGLQIQTRLVPGPEPHLIETLSSQSEEVLRGKRLCILVFAEQLLYQNGDRDRPIWETAGKLSVP